MNDSDFQANTERFTGFAALYDEFRPSPPALLADLLTQITRVSKPALVVDLGSGTGLSTRYWLGRAGKTVGIEPTDAMLECAEFIGGNGIEYRKGFSHATGLPDDCAEIVTCSQALHWMDPLPTFQEVARILKPGGVFVALDYDFPPLTTSWETDLAYSEMDRIAGRLEIKHGVSDGLKRWDKSGHFGRMQESGCFRYVREVVVQHIDKGNSERLVGLALSQGGVQSLLKAGLSEANIGIDRLRELAETKLGPHPKLWFWSS